MSRVKWSSLVVAVVLGLAAQASFAATVTEDFDTDPASWVGSGNMDAPQSFGYSATNNAGGVLGAGTGEAGGHFVRQTLAIYSTDVGSLDPSTDALTLTGRGRFTDVASGGNVFLGWFNDATPLDWQPDNFLGLRTDNADVYISTYADGQSGGETPLMFDLGAIDSFSFTLDYDPNGNGGEGSISATINGGDPVVHNLNGIDRDTFTNLNRFGLFTLFNGADNTADAFWDDLTYTSANAGIPGDVNNDGFVDIFDVNVVSANWGSPGGPTGDANGDGNVDIFDVNLISANWSPPPAPVPEPAGAILAALGLLGLVCGAGARSRRTLR